MKKLRAILIAAATAAALLVAGVVAAEATYRSPLIELPPPKAAARSGACSFADGGWTIVNCSNAAAASSAALNPWSRYVVQCGVNSYIAWGDAATSNDADSSDGYIPGGSWVEFVTTDVVKFYSCLNIGSDSDCRHIECL